MYVANQATTYPLGLHISRVTNIKMVPNSTCPKLPYNEGKKKNFKLYFNTKIPNREYKVLLVNYPRNWKTLFKGKKLKWRLDDNDSKTFWNHIL